MAKIAASVLTRIIRKAATASRSRAARSVAASVSRGTVSATASFASRSAAAGASRSGAAAAAAARAAATVASRSTRSTKRRRCSAFGYRYDSEPIRGDYEPGKDVLDKDVESDEAIWALYKRWCEAFNEERDHTEMALRFDRFRSSAEYVHIWNNLYIEHCQLGRNADGKKDEERCQSSENGKKDEEKCQSSENVSSD